MSLLLQLTARRLLKPRVFSRTLATYKFSPTHEYIIMDGNIGVVGITDHAAEALGDVVYVDLPAVGSKYEAGKSFGSVESVKAASDVYVPVSGEVVEVNSKLVDTPGIVNESPFKEGWFIKLKVSDVGKKELDKLLDEAAYKAHAAANH